MKLKALLLISAALGCVAGPALAKPKAAPIKTVTAPEAAEVTAARLRDAALKSDVAYGFVSDLTTRVGARPAGSEAEKRAAYWAAEELKRLGFANVKVESFPLSLWVRGPESIEITAPFPQALVGTALGQSAAGEAEAEAVLFDTWQEFLDSKADVTGKIVVLLQPMARASNGSGYGRLSGTIRGRGPLEAKKRGAVGFVMRSVGTDTHRFPHTGTTAWQGEGGLPSIALSVPDAEAISRIKRLQAEGKAGPLRLKMKTGGSFPGVGESHNVVADLIGSEHPEEVVVVGGHLDSWDLGTGAIDDGAGMAITMGAVKAMVDQGLKPKRTIRVVFWGSEEVNQPGGNHSAGGAAFAKTREGELGKYVVAGESDFGADKVYAISLPETEDKTFAVKVANVLAPLSIYVDATAKPGGGADTAPLHEAGVPAIDLKQDGYDYFDVHHTADDVLDRIDPAQMQQNVAAWAATLWLIANTDVTFKAPAK